jgi:L,D-peptidoglycan transpeptidase YkuD (ErfK/YbiS/YcfS/YnhG family)
VSRDDMRLTPQGLLWRGRRFPVTLGRGGISTAKREGDGATPAGVHQVLGLLYRPDRIARNAVAGWAQPILPGDLWCDASGHPAYNSHVRAPFAASHEALRRADPLYDIVLITDWNYPQAAPGAGSAIFLHQRRRAGFPTAGCLGFRRDHLLWIVRHLTPGTRLIIPPLASARLHGTRQGTLAQDKA